MTTVESAPSLKIAVIGGGLVGALAACFFAKRNHSVHLYEYREDIRVVEEVRGRSINLALSARGRAALREIGLEDVLVKEHGIPMRARMIHGKDGKLTEIPYDPVNKNCIYSVNRRYLNETLLNAAEKYPNVKFFFNKKLVSADLDNGELTLLDRKTMGEEQASADLIVGADGAFSAVRRIMMKKPLYNFSQTYIEHGYMELCIPPKGEGKFAMAKNNLHIWPRGEFMMIALPNQDGSYTVTLFAPFKTFEGLRTREKLLLFFREQFPDAVPLLGEDRLMKDFFDNSPLPLVSVKCRPFHVKNSAVIMGDAAHAMVPFYGQGMNTGFEDCLLLDRLLEKYNSDLTMTLPAFTELRCTDAHVICDLAMYNYVEMRDLVNRKSFIFRKHLDTILYWLFPNTWVPLYNSVHFSRMPFQKCTANRAWQEKVIRRGIYLLSAVLFAILFGIINRKRF
ncbi:kynurenine 3-monooxygenase isoform X1 [Athalia rosae]|uniref:kynurenine 3-monooxygenase isoform X1 n=2 Tax=Athalia rosae TaxID=37344 RepID=UPI002033C7FB|nr:kynurenine 3-monooxygenase isoform X1 [Athalia rosae]